MTIVYSKPAQRNKYNIDTVRQFVDFRRQCNLVFYPLLGYTAVHTVSVLYIGYQTDIHYLYISESTRDRLVCGKASWTSKVRLDAILALVVMVVILCASVTPFGVLDKAVALDL
jgi:hypothetical protein